MANFPTSVYNPATKSAGQTIQAAHFNDVDAEITAIENGIRNGVAPLNSSGSTVATLSVLGGSTLAGALQVGGNTTLAGGLQVSGASTFASRPVFGPPDGVKLNLSGTIAVTDGGVSTLTWAAGDFAINSSMFNGAASSRVTPQSTGIYMAMATAEFNFNSSGYRTLRIVDSSGGVVSQAVQQTTPVAASVLTMQVMGVKRFDALGGFFKVRATQGSASTMSITANNSVFTVVKL